MCEVVLVSILVSIGTGDEEMSDDDQNVRCQKWWIERHLDFAI